MPTEQLSLNLPVRAAMGAADFVVSESNRDAVAWLDRWPDWPNGILAIHGPAGGGKSHLAHVWQARSEAAFLAGARLEKLPDSGNLILDDNRLGEEDLFHLINHVRAHHQSLLILDREAPARWSARLPDLASRLAAVPAIAVQPPDDALLAAILTKHFSDRQILVAPEVVAYLVRRIERAFSAAEKVATDLDRLALSRRSAITVKLARDLLGDEDSPVL